VLAARQREALPAADWLSLPQHEAVKHRQVRQCSQRGHGDEGHRQLVQAAEGPQCCGLAEHDS